MLEVAVTKGTGWYTALAPHGGVQRADLAQRLPPPLTIGALLLLVQAVPTASSHL